MSSDEDSSGRKLEKFTSERRVNEDEENSDNSAGYGLRDSYGPALPPHLISTSVDNQKLNAISNESYGPRLPDNYRSSRENKDSQAKEEYGPRIPSGDHGKKVIGPEIPEHLLSNATSEKEEEEVTNEEGDAAVYGPSLKLMSDGTIGTGTFNSSLFISKRKGSPETIKKRESWMVDLPPERASSFGLGPRQFRARLPNEDNDRSGWTDAPTDKGKGLSELEKAKKNDEKIIASRQIEERNKEMERLVKKIEKKNKRDKSLLEMHRKMMRKKEKEARKREKEVATIQRRPFDRNTDLQVQKFDLAQRNAVLKKAALLNDRFAQGKSKFL